MPLTPAFATEQFETHPFRGAKLRVIDFVESRCPNLFSFVFCRLRVRIHHGDLKKTRCTCYTSAAASDLVRREIRYGGDGKPTGMTVQMWFDKSRKVVETAYIETAYPVVKK